MRDRVRNRLKEAGRRVEECKKALRPIEPVIFLGILMHMLDERVNKTQFLAETFLSAVAFTAVVILVTMPFNHLACLLRPRDIGIQTGETDSVHRQQSIGESSQLFLKIVTARRKFDHALKMASETSEDFAKKVKPYVDVAVFGGLALANIPAFIEADKTLRQMMVFSYFLYAALIYGAVKHIRHQPPCEPRRKECGVQVDEVSSYQLGL